MSNQQQETKQELSKPDLPFLRALKCAYKLHKAGLTPLDVRCYLSEADDAIERGDSLPSAATPVADILPATFNFADSMLGGVYWASVQRRLEAA